MGTIGTSIKEKLTKAFNPSQLDVIDESAKHAHHRGAHEHAAQMQEMGRGSAESHFHVVIVSEAFDGMSRLAKHRAVLEVLEAEIKQIHAFSLDASVG
ncbi:BolA family protein [Fretibacter rubidus]|uniref:BolA family protein n=1 Tax=Fretibacter rubidus TaxID=570162 RepID=UPI00352B95A0